MINCLIANIIPMFLPIGGFGGCGNIQLPLPWYVSMIVSPILLGVAILCLALVKECCDLGDKLFKIAISIIFIPMALAFLFFAVRIWF